MFQPKNFTKVSTHGPFQRTLRLRQLVKNRNSYGSQMMKRGLLTVETTTVDLIIIEKKMEAT